MYISMGNIWDVRIHHQREQIEDQVSALSKDDESRETETLEPAVMDGLGPPHGIDHLLADLHWRGKHLRISTQDVPEVNLIRCQNSETQG